MFINLNISQGKQKLIVYIALIVVTLAVFWQVNKFDFVNFDDNVYVTENSYVQSGITLDGFLWAFSTLYAQFWHPLTWLSLMLDYQLYGLNAGAYHMTNLILHILSTLLLFWLFNRMTGAIWKSAFIAAFFALHPLHVEAVARIASRKDVLSAFFWMLTLCLYVYYTEKPTIRKYLLVLFIFVLALISKPMVVTLPLIMILLDYWPLKRFESQKGNPIIWQLKEKLLLFIFSTVFSIITFYAQYNPSFKIVHLSYRIANMPVSFVVYLEKIFRPFNLSFLYPIPQQINILNALGAFLLILAVSATVIVSLKRLPYLFVGWLWYSITILPVLGITHIGVHRIQDKYTYLPYIGISIGLAWGISCLIKNEKTRKIVLLPTAIIFLAFLAILSWKQCGYWKNSIELYSHSLDVIKNNFIAYDQRGIAYGQIGQYQLAIDDFNKAIDLKYYKAYNNRGFAYAKLGEYQRAIEDYSEAIRHIPDYANAYNNRAITYLNQGNNKEPGCRDAQKACELGNCRALELAKNKGLCL